MKRFKYKKWLAMGLLLLGVVFSFIYAHVWSQPEIRVYQFGQNIDNGIADAILLMDTQREVLLNTLQRDVGALIEMGQNYEAGISVQEEFSNFREALALLEEYITKVVPPVATIYHRAAFSAQARRAASLRQHRELAVDFVDQQQARVGLLVAFNEAMVELYEMLVDVETLFFETDPWVTVPFFQGILNQFEQIAKLHGEYLEAVSLYARTKTRFYLAIRQDL